MRVTAKARVSRLRFAELSKQGKRGAAARNKEIAEDAAKIARDTVHVVTGATRDSIRVQRNPRTGNASVVAGEGAVYEELGTVFRAPHPFMRPAAEQAAKRSRNRKVNLYGRG